jgi:hypothetical protein
MDTESVILTEGLASIVRSRCNCELPGLEAILDAALKLSVTPDETRYPRIRIRTSYEKQHPFFVMLELPLDKLPGLAPAVHYPDCALLCTWRGSWEISGITKAFIQQFDEDGISLDVTAPLTLSISSLGSLNPIIRVAAGKILERDDSWEKAIAGLRDKTSSANPLPSRTTAIVLGRAIYKTSIRGHGGAFLVLPPDAMTCLEDISIGCPAKLGIDFDLPLGSPGHLDVTRIENCSDALAALTGVDGAVVMNHDLSLLGFGATIRTLQTDGGSRLEGGHRHKSAMAFCTQHRGAVAVVVSQDGPITVYGADSLRE